MGKNLKISDTDHHQASNRMFDGDNDAQRVVIVGGGISFDGQINVPTGSTQIQTIEVPTIVKEIQIVEVPIIQKEIQIVEVEKQVIVKEFVTIEIPVIVETVKTVEIEKPVTVIEYKTIETHVVVKEYLPFPTIIKVVLAVQAVCTVIGVIINACKK